MFSFLSTPTTNNCIISNHAMTYTNDLPSWSVLTVNYILDNVFQTLCVSNWRDYIPAGMRVPGGWLSHESSEFITDVLPRLGTYSDFVAQNKSSFWNFSSMMQFAMTPSTSLGVVTTKDALVVLLCLVLLMRQIKGILIPYFCSIGRQIGRSTHGLLWEKNNEERIIKFGEYVFRFIYHLAVSIFGLWYFWDKPWWDEQKGGVETVFIGHPHHPIDVGMTWYYLIQCAYNIEAMLSLMELSFTFKTQSIIKDAKIQSPLKISWSPTCRGDFPEMFVHHVITNLLVIGSSHCRFTRIGSMVFMVHDISDVPVDMSKLANFMKWKVATIASFSLLLVTWVVARLYILPFVIVKGVFDYTSRLHEVESLINVKHYFVMLPAFEGLLVGITSLHGFWFLILVRILFHLVVKGERHDLSEHKQGEKSESESLQSSESMKESCTEKKMA